MENILFGWIATSFSLVYKLPQIYKIIKTNVVDGISVKAYIIQTLSYFFYIIHGIFNKDYPIVVMGCSSFIQCLFIIHLWCKYKNRNEMEYDE